MRNDDLIINDSVYGFVTVPHGLLRDIVEHPYFQRLSRIRQLGLASFVYPGATHTRKEHSLGTFHLTQKAIKALQNKGYFIFEQEEEGLLAAALLHDIGHGPMSHQLEGKWLDGVNHEAFTLQLMHKINEEWGGALDGAIEIYGGKATRPFLHELICSQLDMDRLDYLCRDSYYSGVREGSIGADRIIGMLDIADERLVVKSKGVYSIENYLMARRLMYWQVYLHKTSVASERMLRSVMQRAQWLVREGVDVNATPALIYFLTAYPLGIEKMEDEETLYNYISLDDNDIWCALKQWAMHEDEILATLSRSLVNRQLFKVEVFDGQVPEGYVEQLEENAIQKLGISPLDVHYFVGTYEVKKKMYSPDAQGIEMIFKSGEKKELSQVSQIISTDKTTTRDSRIYVYHYPV